MISWFSFCRSLYFGLIFAFSIIFGNCSSPSININEDEYSVASSDILVWGPGEQGKFNLVWGLTGATMYFGGTLQYRVTACSTASQLDIVLSGFHCLFFNPCSSRLSPSTYRITVSIFSRGKNIICFFQLGPVQYSTFGLLYVDYVVQQFFNIFIFYIYYFTEVEFCEDNLHAKVVSKFNFF